MIFEGGMVIKVFIFIFYAIGMIVTDKVLANPFIDGTDEEYEKRKRMGDYEYDNNRVVRKITTIINILVKIFVPLFWPVVWGVSLLCVLRRRV